MFNSSSAALVQVNKRPLLVFLFSFGAIISMNGQSSDIDSTLSRPWEYNASSTILDMSRTRIDFFNGNNRSNGRSRSNFHDFIGQVDYRQFVGKFFHFGISMVGSTNSSMEDNTLLDLRPRVGFAIPAPGHDPMVSLALEEALWLTGGDLDEGSTWHLSLEYPLLMPKNDYAIIFGAGRRARTNEDYTFRKPFARELYLSIRQHFVHHKGFGNASQWTGFERGQFILDGRSTLEFNSNRIDDEIPLFDGSNGVEFLDLITQNLIFSFAGGHMLTDHLSARLSIGHLMRFQKWEESNPSSFLGERTSITEVSLGARLNMTPRGLLFIEAEYGRAIEDFEARFSGSTPSFNPDPFNFRTFYTGMGLVLPLSRWVHFTPQFGYGSIASSEFDFLSEDRFTRLFRVRVGLSTVF